MLQPKKRARSRREIKYRYGSEAPVRRMPNLWTTNLWRDFRQAVEILYKTTETPLAEASDQVDDGAYTLSFNGPPGPTLSRSHVMRFHVINLETSILRVAGEVLNSQNHHPYYSAVA